MTPRFRAPERATLLVAAMVALSLAIAVAATCYVVRNGDPAPQVERELPR